MGARTAIATATWYPQHPQHGGGYLSAPVPQARPIANGPCPSPSSTSPSQQFYPQPSAYGPLPQNPMKMSPNASPYAQYALNYYHHQHAREREREAYYRSRNMMLPQSDWRPYGPTHAQQPPGQDPTLYYQQQQQQAAAHGFPPGAVPSGPPGAPATYPASAYPPRLPAAPAPMRAPHPQPHMMDTASQSGSRAPSTGPAPSAASPDSSSRMSAGVDSSDQRPGSAAVGPPAATHTPGPHSVSQPSTSMQLFDEEFSSSATDRDDCQADNPSSAHRDEGMGDGGMTLCTPGLRHRVPVAAAATAALPCRRFLRRLH
ncbi:hypothetical protein COOONC_02553 [Cooperia oncophora]